MVLVNGTVKHLESVSNIIRLSLWEKIEFVNLIGLIGT
jgi:hypothetical protein